MYYEKVYKLIKKRYAEREARGEKPRLSDEDKETLVDQFRATVKRFPDKVALMTRVGENKWSSKTYKEFLDLANQIAAATLDAGIEPGDRVGLQAHTREEWAILDEGLLSIGAVVVCLYPSLAPNVVEYQMKDADVKLAFIENEGHAKILIDAKERLPLLKLAVIIDDPRKKNPDFKFPDWMITLEEFISRGKRLLEEKPGLQEKIDEIASNIDPDDIATIIYTSGTTGMPKGAVLTHWNIASNVRAADWVSGGIELEKNLSFLPLSHSLERMAGHFYPIYKGMTTAFASDLDNLARDLQEVKPDYLTGVPRVFEKIYAYAMMAVKNYSSIKQKIFWWAVEVGKKYSELFRAGKPIPLGLKFKMKLARLLVFNKFLAMTGGRLLFFISGGASLPTELAKFYGAVGLTIIEGYGLTETSPVTNMNNPLDIVFGTVGPPIPGTEEKIAEDGEILVRGPQVFKGYWKKEEATKAVLEPDGWFHTGDLGEFDEKGNLKIIGRKKEIFVLSTGKKVPPIVVEDLAATVPFIQQIVLMGDGRKFISALVTPNFQYLADHVKREMPEAAAVMPDFETASKEEIEAFLEREDIRELFQKDVDKVNSQVDPFAQIKKFVILPHELTEETGDLTPSLKYKRKKIFEHYQDKIEAMYNKDISVELSEDFNPLD